MDNQVSAAALGLSQHSQETLSLSNESDLRHHLWLTLQPWARHTLGLDQTALAQEGTGKAGRFDSRIGRAIIEYKTPGHFDKDSNRRKAAQQGIDYVNDATMGADVVVLTDGKIWATYRDSSAEPEPGEQIWLDLGGPVSADPLDRFIWRENDPMSCERVLTLISTVKSTPLSASSVASHLGLDRPEVLEIIKLFAAELSQRNADDRSDTLFDQWILMAGVSYGIATANQAWPGKSEELLGATLAPVLAGATYAEALFSLHTYVALAAKLIGTELLSVATGHQENRPSEWVSLTDPELRERFVLLETGTLAAEMRAPGLLAGDLFGWYAHIHSDALVAALRLLLRSLGELAWARAANSARGITGDLLRDFYSAVVPRPLRRALGEFFTPQWLAERTLAQAVELAGLNGESASVLDPSCGSGTFLVAALQRELIAQDRQHPDHPALATTLALERVVGFDINPVAVLMARINLLLALGDRVEHLPVVEPRVYEADSILLPSVVGGQQELSLAPDSHRLPLSIGEIDVPTCLTSLDGLRILRENIERGVANSRSSHIFAQRLKTDMTVLEIDSHELESAADAATTVYEGILQLAAEGRDGVWARIVEQSFAPATLGRSDLVVGNPPWINWKHLPELWQSRSEATWKGWGLWAKKTKDGGIPLADISALLLARAVATYCEPGGVVGFLLPQAILTADPGNERVRRCNLRPDPGGAASIQPEIPFCPVGVDDWSAVHPFSPDAANFPIALYVKANTKAVFPVPKTVWTRRPKAQLATDAHWGEVRRLLLDRVEPVSPVEPQNATSPWVAQGSLELLPKNDPRREYIWGQGFHTRGADGHLTVQVLSPHPYPDGSVDVESLPECGKNTKGETPRRGRVEAKMLWPLVRGRNVHPYAVDPSGEYAILAHDPADLTRILTVDEMLAHAPLLYDFLEPWKERLASRSPYQQLQPSADKPWGVLGPTERLSRATPVVLCRYIHPKKHPPAAVYLAQFDERLGFATSCYPNNKSNVHIPAGGEREAHFIAAWVNSPPSQSAIERVASSTTIGPTTLQRLPIPRYDQDDPDHARLADIAENASNGHPVDEMELEMLVGRTRIR